eukprot:1649046-Rhodomonas_salina.1
MSRSVTSNTQVSPKFEGSKARLETQNPVTLPLLGMAGQHVWILRRFDNLYPPTGYHTIVLGNSQWLCSSLRKDKGSVGV